MYETYTYVLFCIIFWTNSLFLQWLLEQALQITTVYIPNTKFATFLKRNAAIYKNSGKTQPKYLGSEVFHYVLYHWRENKREICGKH